MPETFIRIVHHPHSEIANDLIIPLVHNGSANPAPDHSDPRTQNSSTNIIPWLPFQTQQDFEYTSSAVRGVIPSKIIDEQLYGMHHGWSKKSRITLCNSADMKAVLATA